MTEDAQFWAGFGVGVIVLAAAVFATLAFDLAPLLLIVIIVGAIGTLFSPKGHWWGPSWTNDPYFWSEGSPPGLRGFFRGILYIPLALLVGLIIGIFTGIINV